MIGLRKYTHNAVFALVAAVALSATVSGAMADDWKRAKFGPCRVMIPASWQVDEPDPDSKSDAVLTATDPDDDTNSIALQAVDPSKAADFSAWRAATQALLQPYQPKVIEDDHMRAAFATKGMQAGTVMTVVGTDSSPVCSVTINTKEGADALVRRIADSLSGTDRRFPDHRGSGADGKREPAQVGGEG